MICEKLLVEAGCIKMITGHLTLIGVVLSRNGVPQTILMYLVLVDKGQVCNSLKIVGNHALIKRGSAV